MFSLFTNIISPHQIPLAKELVKRLGENNYHYFYTEKQHTQRREMGWKCEGNESWCQYVDENEQKLQETFLLFSGLRSENIFSKRLSMGKITCYVSERWFKPPLGFLRMLVPSFYNMAKRFSHYLDSKNFFYFPQGIHAARDMLRIYGLFHGDWHCLWNAPKVAFESKPGGRIIPLQKAIDNKLLSSEDIIFGKKHGFVQIPSDKWDKISLDDPYSKYYLWGYFVEPSQFPPRVSNSNKKILWVGRMLDWKHVETLVKSIPNSMELNLYGHGPEEAKLHKIAAKNKNIHFHDFVPISQVRNLMNNNDIYVLASDGGEGWGAVLNEAMEERMKVLATLESGAGATMLPIQLLFQSGNTKELKRKLQEEFPALSIGNWSVINAANFLIDFLNNKIK